MTKGKSIPTIMTSIRTLEEELRQRGWVKEQDGVWRYVAKTTSKEGENENK